ncbi:BnaAnng09320D [Brassica napus]|uniref:Kinesin-like protein n=1 Tax=Brassica napus TaxID=3708 RepID=A0A078IAH8_BRANA|nr:BnaAnng09320D [Brassica napus]
MASRKGSKLRKAGYTNLKGADSTASSATSSSKLYQETSIDDGHSSPASSSAQSKQQFFSSDSFPQSSKPSKENVTVTVRFRPLSPREIRNGEEVAWYADGETIVRNENNPTIAYAYDRVFGPTTTTRNVYDVAAHQVVNGAMEGINGTIFAYGVTSSGKTHTMHGDQRSPGIIPLAVKDAFSIIQETPNREFLLRISYLELYNEVVNDLLNPEGHNLRIREDKQVCDSLSDHLLIHATTSLNLLLGTMQRHVGSTNFNLLSSRSHTILTLVFDISFFSPDKIKSEAVHLSQLNLVDLAGSESSKVETSGLRRKEGSYINKSLLTLETVSDTKLRDVKASHVPYRDSKLTRILHSSLSGHGRVSLICTVTPASRSSEETHNTLKFGHRAKHIEIQPEQNKITDEKSLIKKYQHEIRRLREELEQLKQDIVPVPPLKDMGAHDTILLNQKVCSKDTFHPHLYFLGGHFVSLCFKNLINCLHVPVEGSPEIRDVPCREEKKSRKHGLLNWLKPKKRDNSSSASDQSSVEQLSESREDREAPEDMETLETSNKIIDELDLMRVQKKILSEGVALQSSSLKRLSDEAEEINALHDGIKAKSDQIATLEKLTNLGLSVLYYLQAVAELRDQLNEKSFEFEVIELLKAAENRIIRGKLNQKTCEREVLQEEVRNLKQQLSNSRKLAQETKIEELKWKT